MGWHAMTIEIGLSLDAHGGDKEKEHDRLAVDLLVRIRRIAEEEKYREIVMDVRSSG